MRCRICGKECELTHSISTFVKAGLYQTTRIMLAVDVGISMR